MANVTYTVKKGDTLSEIAAKYNTTTANLVKLNNIKNANFITVGQVLIISGTGKSSSKNTSSGVKITDWGVLSTSDQTIYVTWAWDKDHTDHYDMKWEYTTGDGHWWKDYDGSNYKTTSNKQYLYSIPSGAKKVRFAVRAVAKKYKKNKKEYPYFTTTDFSTWKTHEITTTVEKPDKPSAPTVTVNKYKLTAAIENLDSKIKQVRFEIVKNDNKRHALQDCDVTRNRAAFTTTIAAGYEYKARCRVSVKQTASSGGSGTVINPYVWSDWSEYSSNVMSMPSASAGIKTIRALSSTSVYVDWYNVSNAASYEIEYTTEKRYFGSSNEVKKMTVEAPIGHAELTGLESGKKYFVRVRAVNAQGESAWTEIASVVVGKKPAAPTTWSSTTTVMVGENLTLYWVHNSEDGSSQRYGEVEITVNDLKNTYTVKNDYNNEETKDQTSSYVVDTSSYAEGAVIKWRVRTSGIANEYSDWSIERTVNVYAPPVVDLNVTDTGGVSIDTLLQLPFRIVASALPYTQTPVGYHLAVTANESYETVDNVGNVKMVSVGDEVFSKYYDINTVLRVELSASDLSLCNNVQYTITCTVSMDSGLTATAQSYLTVAWEGDTYEPNASIVTDETDLTATIVPYCDDGEGNLFEDVVLSVYRREFDGTFTEIMTDVPNTGAVYLTDPHPALDFARYRIIAKSTKTGSVSYYDAPGIPVGGIAAVLQWDEEWHPFDVTEDSENIEDELSEITWSGSMLKLPYNIDVSDATNPDVELVEYIGRSHPVSYYGTQVGSTSSWNMDVPKNDSETLYALRRLSIWMGDVYVREPSGSGYWANVKVSFSQKHKEVTIPVTLTITRVEGGV